MNNNKTYISSSNSENGDNISSMFISLMDKMNDDIERRNDVEKYYKKPNGVKKNIKKKY